MSNNPETQNPRGKEKTASSQDQNDIREFIKWGVIILCVWIVYLFASYLLVFLSKFILPQVFMNAGTFQIGAFGDYFGALNTLFAGLAFAGIIITIRQQSADFQATKHEMREQTKQFKIADFYRRVELLQQLENKIPNCWPQDLIEEKYKQWCSITPQRELSSPLAMLAYVSFDVLSIFYAKKEEINEQYLNHVVSLIRANKRFVLPWLLSFSCLVEDYHKFLSDDKDLLKILLRSFMSSIDLAATHMLIYMYQNAPISRNVLPILKEVQLEVDLFSLNCENNLLMILRNAKAFEIFHNIIDGNLTIEQAKREWEAESK